MKLPVRHPALVKFALANKPKPDRSIAVLALLFDVSDKNTDLLDTLASASHKIKTPGAIAKSGPLNFSSIINHVQTTPLREYNGSLTTPPCKEGITFLVAEKPLPVNPTSFNAMKKVLRFNSRFTQGGLGEPNLLERAALSIRKGGNGAAAASSGLVRS
jgi:carbonic anhydrase